MPELYVDSLYHYFKGQNVLNGVHLQCSTGDIKGILGRNGCGKSTLLKCIFGSIKANHIYLKLNGKIIKKPAYLTQQIAYLPQHPFLPQQLKLETIINLLCNRYKKELLSIKLIQHYLKSKITTLSGGTVRLVEAILTIYSDAAFVLLDEPFSQLSPVMIQEIKKHILLLKQQKAFVITDHYYRDIIDISTEIILLKNGSNYTINSMEDLSLHNYIPYH